MLLATMPLLGLFVPHPDGISVAGILSCDLDDQGLGYVSCGHEPASQSDENEPAHAAARIAADDALCTIRQNLYDASAAIDGVVTQAELVSLPPLSHEFRRRYLVSSHHFLSRRGWTEDEIETDVVDRLTVQVDRSLPEGLPRTIEVHIYRGFTMRGGGSVSIVSRVRDATTLIGKRVLLLPVEYEAPGVSYLICADESQFMTTGGLAGSAWEIVASAREGMLRLVQDMSRSDGRRVGGTVVAMSRDDTGQYWVLSVDDEVSGGAISVLVPRNKMRSSPSSCAFIPRSIKVGDSVHLLACDTVGADRVVPCNGAMGVFREADGDLILGGWNLGGPPW
jgi:hypothetical protein